MDSWSNRGYKSVGLKTAVEIEASKPIEEPVVIIEDVVPEEPIIIVGDESATSTPKIIN